MKWKKFTIHTTTLAADLVVSLLCDLGIGGVQIEDNIPLTEAETKGMFIDILPELPPDDGHADVSFYLEPEEDVSGILAGIKEGLKELSSWMDIGKGDILASETEDADWMNNWKQYFKPFTVEDIVIKPTWETLPAGAGGRFVIEMDPGTAFGTGKHETTQLCIRALKKLIKPADKVLDVGTGSGILGICALKLGAGKVWGTDLDENAIHAVRENLAANGLDEGLFELCQGNLLNEREVKDWAGYGCFDIVVANILADVIIPLIPETAAHLKLGGYLITSGIIDAKEMAVLAAFEACPAFGKPVITRQGDWVCITARKV